MSIEQVSVEYFFDHDVIAVVQQIFVFNQSKYPSDHEIWWIFSGATKTRGVRSFNSPTFSSPLFIISWRWLGHYRSFDIPLPPSYFASNLRKFILQVSNFWKIRDRFSKKKRYIFHFIENSHFFSCFHFLIWSNRVVCGSRKISNLL